MRSPGPLRGFPLHERDAQLTAGTSDNTPLPFAGTTNVCGLLDTVSAGRWSAVMMSPTLRSVCVARGVSVGQFVRAAEVVSRCDARAFAVIYSGRDRCPWTGLTSGTMRRCWSAAQVFGLVSAPCDASVVWADQVRALIAGLCPDAAMCVLSAVACRLLSLQDALAAKAIAAHQSVQRSTRSWHLPDPQDSVDGRVLRTVPVWTSRSEWERQVGHLLTTESGTQVRKKVRVAEDVVVAVARILAAHADSRTGRHVTVSHEQVAAEAPSDVELSVAKVRRARRVLRLLGLQVDVRLGRKLSAAEIQAARAHHGGTQMAVASDVSLVSPREAVAACAHLPRRSTKRSLPLRSRKVTQRASARESQKRPPRTPERRRRVRALPVQRLVAGLVALAPGLDKPGKAHLGALCAAVSDFGVDPQVWTAKDLVEVLNRDSRQRRWDWPAQIDSPARYLRYRLARIDWSEEVPPSVVRQRRHAAIVADQRARREAEEGKVVASAETRAAARAQLAAVLASRR